MHALLDRAAIGSLFHTLSKILPEYIFKYMPLPLLGTFYSIQITIFPLTLPRLVAIHRS